MRAPSLEGPRRPRKCREAFEHGAVPADARSRCRGRCGHRFDGDARQVLRAVAALGVAVVKRVEVVG